MKAKWLFSGAEILACLLYTSKAAALRSVPGDEGEALAEVCLGDEVSRSAVCDNNWSKVSVEKNGNKVIGYIQNQMLSADIQIQPENDQVEVCLLYTS